MVRARPTRESRPRTALAGARPASDPSPTDPVLRANPFPEVTDPICRLPLPTLFYRLEAVHLGDLLRISVRSGTRITPSPPDFQGPTRVHRTPREARCFTGTTALSPAKPIPGRPSLTKKRELFPGPAPTSPVSFALPHWTRHEDAPISVLGFGNINPIPFRRLRRRVFALGRIDRRFGTEFSYRLGSTDPCSNAVHMEPFSTSVFKVLV